MRYVITDCETCSEAELKAVGSIRYAQHSSTDILCISYCLVENDIRSEIKTWTPSDTIPN